MAAGVGEHLPVEVVEVGSAPVEPDDGVVLLVLGVPTHALGISRIETRHEAVDRREGALPVSSGMGVPTQGGSS